MNPLERSGERFGHLAADVVEMRAEYVSRSHQRCDLPVTSGAETERPFANSRHVDARDSGVGGAALPSIPKAVAMLGIGRENLRYIHCDDAYRMLPSALDRAIAEDKSRGRKPIAVVASAGTVKTGSIDPLMEIAEIAHAQDLWLHV